MLAHDRVREERPSAARVGVARIPEHPLARPQLEHRGPHLAHRDAVAEADAEGVGKLRVGDRLRERCLPGCRLEERELEGDHQPQSPALERARAIAEAERRCGDPRQLAGLEVEEFDRGQAGGELLPVGADVLHGRGSRAAGDAGERLDARPALLDGVRDDVVPALARLHPQTHGALARPVSGRVLGGAGLAHARRFAGQPLDAVAGDPNHGAVEAVIADDHVGAAAEQQPVLRLGPCGLHGVEQLGAGRGRDQLRGRAADPKGGQRGELGHVGGHAGRATTAWALPSTVWPLQLTVRSMRTPASSRAPTLALTLTTAPVSGSTTTGRVKRT